MSDDDVERRLQDLERAHRLTQWYMRRADRDLAEIAVTEAGHKARLQRTTEILDAHTARFDSIDAQLKSLTQLVGGVLKQGEKLDEVLQLLRGKQPPGENGD